MVDYIFYRDQKLRPVIAGEVVELESSDHNGVLGLFEVLPGGSSADHNGGVESSDGEEEEECPLWGPQCSDSSEGSFFQQQLLHHEEQLEKGRLDFQRETEELWARRPIFPARRIFPDGLPGVVLSLPSALPKDNRARASEKWCSKQQKISEKNRKGFWVYHYTSEKTAKALTPLAPPPCLVFPTGNHQHHEHLLDHSCSPESLHKELLDYRTRLRSARPQKLGVPDVKTGQARVCCSSSSPVDYEFSPLNAWFDIYSYSKFGRTHVNKNTPQSTCSHVIALYVPYGHPDCDLARPPCRIPGKEHRRGLQTKHVELVRPFPSPEPDSSGCRTSTCDIAAVVEKLYAPPGVDANFDWELIRAQAHSSSAVADVLPSFACRRGHLRSELDGRDESGLLDTSASVLNRELGIEYRRLASKHLGDLRAHENCPVFNGLDLQDPRIHVVVGQVSDEAFWRRFERVKNDLAELVDAFMTIPGMVQAPFIP